MKDLEFAAKEMRQMMAKIAAVAARDSDVDKEYLHMQTALDEAAVQIQVHAFRIQNENWDREKAVVAAARVLGTAVYQLVENLIHKDDLTHGLNFFILELAKTFKAILEDDLDDCHQAKMNLGEHREH